MQTVCYRVGGSLYLNITNRCPCDCVFCIRRNGDSAYGSDSLWLDHEPTVEEVIRGLSAHDLDACEEIVFCGYGEPLTRLNDVIEICKYIRSVTGTPIRVDTNGLSDLMEGAGTAHRLEGLVDALSISLNAPTAEEYVELTKPIYGSAAYGAMLHFAREAKKVVPRVGFTVVDILPPDRVAACKKVADEMGLPLRVRRHMPG